MGLSSSSPGQCVSKFHLSPKTTILDPQVLTDVQLKLNLVLSHPLTPLLFYILHPSAQSFDTNTFGSTKPVGKKDVGLSSSSPGQRVSKFHLSPKTTSLDPQVLTDVQLKLNLVLSHPLTPLLYSTFACAFLNWFIVGGDPTVHRS